MTLATLSLPDVLPPLWKDRIKNFLQNLRHF